MTCDKAIRLVEKLADGEANAHERSEAEQHLDHCEECTAHYQFVRELASASETIDLPEPPEAYWQQFPSKVLARIEENERDEPRGFWQTLFTPSAFRLGAAAATLILVLAVGSSVYRDDPRLLDPQRPEVASRVSPEEAPVQSPGKASSDEEAPGLDDNAGRDPEAASPARDAQLRSESEPPRPSTPPRAATAGAEKDELGALERRVEVEEAEDVADEDLQNASAPAARRLRANPPPAPAEAAGESALAEQGVLAEAVTADSLRQQSPRASGEAQPASKAGQTSSFAAGEASTAVLASSTDPCAQSRLYLADNDDDAPGVRDARYQIALCSLRSYDAEPNEDTRAEATRDAEAFLALEDDSDRAEEIRARLEPLRR